MHPKSIEEEKIYNILKNYCAEWIGWHLHKVAPAIINKQYIHALNINLTFQKESKTVEKMRQQIQSQDMIREGQLITCHIY